MVNYEVVELLLLDLEVVVVSDYNSINAKVHGVVGLSCLPPVRGKV